MGRGGKEKGWVGRRRGGGWPCMEGRGKEEGQVWREEERRRAG